MYRKQVLLEKLKEAAASVLPIQMGSERVPPSSPSRRTGGSSGLSNRMPTTSSEIMR